MLKVVDNVLDLIGNTPLLHLVPIKDEGEADIYLKLEFMNPGGSIKDRAAIGMIEDAEKSGRLKPGGTIIEPTAGNTGVGLALVGILKGYSVIVVMPEGYSIEKQTIVRGFGAKLILTPKDDGMQGAIAKCHELSKEIPNSIVPQQFINPANPLIHEEMTGREIWEALSGKVDAIAIGAGTGGTFTGVSRYLKKRNPGVKAFLVQPPGSVFAGGEAGKHLVEGIGNTWIPETLDMSLVTEVFTISDEDSFKMVDTLAKKSGILVGGSTGANVCGAKMAAKLLGQGKVVVTIAPDGAERYMSKYKLDGRLPK